MPRFFLLGLLLVVLTLPACDSAVLPSEMSDEVIPDLTSPPFQTDSLSYSLGYREALDLYETRVWWTTRYRNDRDSTSYLRFCASLGPEPMFQRMMAGAWVDAMASNRVSQGPCEMKAVAPGDSLLVESLLYFTGSDFEGRSGLPPDSIPGVYRLLYSVYRAPGSVSLGPHPDDLLQLEQRVSNDFAIRIRGDL